MSFFLSKRTNFVRVYGVLSQPIPVNAGVPRGSILAPNLLPLFTKDFLTTTSFTVLPRTSFFVSLLLTVMRIKQKPTSVRVALITSDLGRINCLGIYQCFFQFIQDFSPFDLIQTHSLVFTRKFWLDLSVFQSLSLLVWSINSSRCRSPLIFTLVSSAARLPIWIDDRR